MKQRPRHLSNPLESLEIPQKPSQPADHLKSVTGAWKEPGFWNQINQDYNPRLLLTQLCHFVGAHVWLWRASANVKNNAILKEFTQLPVSTLTPKSSSIRLVVVKEQLEEKGGGEPCMPFPFPVGVNIADRELHPLAPSDGLVLQLGRGQRVT